MMTVPRLDHDLNVRIGRGEFDEVGRPGRTGEVFPNGRGGSAVFAVADVEFLELGDSARGHAWWREGLRCWMGRRFVGLEWEGCRGMFD